MEYEEILNPVTFEDLKKYKYDNMGFAVLVHIEDECGNILLQQRGSKARDDDKMYTEVGGGYEEFDKTFDLILHQIIYRVPIVLFLDALHHSIN